MNRHARIQAAEERDDPSFFTGLALDKAALVQHVGHIKTYADLIASAVNAKDTTVAKLKDIIASSDKAAAEMQRRVDRLRSGLSHMDRKISVFQARKPRA